MLYLLGLEENLKTIYMLSKPYSDGDLNSDEQLKKAYLNFLSKIQPNTWHPQKEDGLFVFDKKIIETLIKNHEADDFLTDFETNISLASDSSVRAALSKVDEAKNYIEQAYALNKDDPAILDSLGWIYFLSGDLNRAELYLRQAAAKLEDAEILSHLAEVLWHKGSKDEARVMLQRAKNVNDKHPKVLQAMKTIEP